MFNKVLIIFLFSFTLNAIGEITVKQYGDEENLAKLPGAKSILFEDYVGTLPYPTTNNGEILQVSGNASTFISPSTTAPAVGMLVDAANLFASVQVYYGDFTSSVQHADIGGPASGRPASGSYGDRVIFKFVDPENPGIKCTVAGVGFRWGSIVEDMIEIRFYDINEVEITAANNIVPGEDLGTSGTSSCSYIAEESGVPVSAIYKVVIRNKNRSANDIWTIGAFGSDPNVNNDMSLYVHTAHPFICLESPYGGQSLQAGQEYNVQWESLFPQSRSSSCNIKLELSIDGGSQWSEITTINSPEVKSFNWTVPDVNSDNCLLKIYDECDTSLSDQSEAVFRIFQCDVNDLTYDCKVDLSDVAMLSSNWLQTAVCDLPDLTNDCNVNNSDFAVIAEDWLQSGKPDSFFQSKVWFDTPFVSQRHWLDARFRDLTHKAIDRMFVNLDEGSVLAFNRVNVSGGNVLRHRKTYNLGQSWQPNSSFYETTSNAAPQNAIKDMNGTIHLFYIEYINWGYEDFTQNHSKVWRISSNDEGLTWSSPQLIDDSSCGNLIGVIVTSSGTIILPVEKYVADPERIVIDTYSSVDGGQSWRISNRIDLGGGNVPGHSGAIEPDLVELQDGSIWMLIRTIWGEFWSAYSYDQGLTWQNIGASGIQAGNSPCSILRLSSGRLVMTWNRGDGWYRDELSIALSEDDGQSWTEPFDFVGIDKSEEYSRGFTYPLIFEPEPGVIWISCFQQVPAPASWPIRLFSVNENELVKDLFN